MANNEMISIRLQCSYQKRLRSLNQNYMNEYEQGRIVPKLYEAMGALGQVEFTPKLLVTFGFLYEVNSFWLIVRLWDNETSAEILSLQALADTNVVDLSRKLTEHINKIINQINSSNVQWITFEEDNIKVHENVLYGAFYDLARDQYIDPPKVIKKQFTIEEIEKGEVTTALVNAF